MTPWTVAHWAALSIGFPRQEYWSGLPFPSPGHLPNPRTEPMSLESCVTCVTTSTLFNLYVSLFDHTLFKVLSMEYYFELTAFQRLSLAQWNIFIVITIFYYYYLCGCPFWPSLIIFKSILALAGAEMPACGIHLPCKGSSFLWAEGSPCVHVWVGKRLLDSVSVWGNCSFWLFWLNPSYHPYLENLKAFLSDSEGKESARNAGDLDSIPGLGRSPGGGNAHSSILAWTISSRRAWRATVPGVAEPDTLSD